MNQNLPSSGEITRQHEQLEEFAFRYGQAYDSYLSTEGDLRLFWSSNGRALIAYAIVGKYVHVQGGLLGPVEERPRLLTEFCAFIKLNQYTATFYNIGEGDLPLFRDQGLQITKWGEEPLLDVPNLTWSGHEFEWVRRQVNYCRRQKVVVTEIRRGDHSEDEWLSIMNEIDAITNDCLSTKPQRGDVEFFNGKANPPRWDRRRLFVARAEKGAGRIEGFLICLPYDGGTQWAIDTYRHRLDAPRGVIPFLIYEAVNNLRNDDIHSVSLCLCPAVRYEHIPGDSWIIRRCLQFGFNYASAFFDMPGEYHFKSRFRPKFIRRFICHSPKATIGSMWSTIVLSAALKLDVQKLASSVWKRFSRPMTRKNLALPTVPTPVPAPVAVEPPLRSRRRIEEIPAAAAVPR